MQKVRHRMPPKDSGWHIDAAWYARRNGWPAEETVGWLKRMHCPCAHCKVRRRDVRQVRNPGRWGGNEFAALRANLDVLDALEALA